MNQKGFATIFGLVMILVIALIVKGIQEAEANHAREVFNFQMEQRLQHAAESSLIEAAEKVRLNPELLPYSKAQASDKKVIISTTKNFKINDRSIEIEIEVRGERGKIYHYGINNLGNTYLVYFPIYDADGNKTGEQNYRDGVYLMSRAALKSDFTGENIYRRAYGYFLENAPLEIYFMELP